MTKLSSITTQADLFRVYSGTQCDYHKTPSIKTYMFKVNAKLSPLSYCVTCELMLDILFF